jgi:hypothetical protein
MAGGLELSSLLAGGPECSIMKQALITGITGQDGSDQAELHLARGCEVHGSFVGPRRSTPVATTTPTATRTSTRYAQRQLPLRFSPKKAAGPMWG